MPGRRGRALARDIPGAGLSEHAADLTQQITSGRQGQPPTGCNPWTGPAGVRSRQAQVSGGGNMASLGVLETSETPDGVTVPKYRALRPLTQDEEDEYLEQVASLTETFRDLFTFRAIQANFDETMDVFVQWGRLPKGPAGLTAVGTQPVLMELERRLFNLLASGQAFIEHLRVRIQGRFGRGSTQVENYKAALDSLTEDCPGLPILRGVRNLMVHRAPPRLRVSAQPQVDGSIVVTASLSKSELLGADRKWHKTARLALRRYDDDVPLIPLLRDYYLALSSLQRTALQMTPVSL